MNDGKAASAPSTVEISVTTPVIVKLAAGLNHTLALQDDGTVWAWGENMFGQIGDGTTSDRLRPVRVPGKYRDVVAGAGHAVAVRSDGSVWTWGRDEWGQQANGGPLMEQAIKSPTQIGTGFAQVHTGVFHSYAMKVSGELWGWGWNECGRLGGGTTQNRTAPVQAVFGADFSSITAGDRFAYALGSSGDLVAWGCNEKGMLGDGSTVNRQLPVLIGTDFAAVVAGDQAGYGLRKDGTRVGVGGNDAGQLGDETTTQRSRPVLIATDVVQAAAGGYGAHTISGLDAFGNTVVREVRHGGAHAFAVKSNGELWGWGSNKYGQIGDGTINQRLSPVLVGSGFKAVVAGGYEDNAHSVAIKADGTVWAWGGNPKGQVGDGTTQTRLSQCASPSTTRVGQGACGWMRSRALGACGSGSAVAEGRSRPRLCENSARSGRKRIGRLAQRRSRLLVIVGGPSRLQRCRSNPERVSQIQDRTRAGAPDAAPCRAPENVGTRQERDLRLHPSNWRNMGPFASGGISSFTSAFRSSPCLFRDTAACVRAAECVRRGV